MKLEKKVISKDYLIPSLCKEIAINQKDIIFDDEIIKYIIDNKLLKIYTKILKKILLR